MDKKPLKLSPTSRKILLIAGVGAFIAATLVFPGLPRILKGKKFDVEDFLGEDEWEPFDRRRLRQRLKEMHQVKLVKISSASDQYVVQITEKGKRHLLRYRTEELSIVKPEKWDGKWRIVTYDIPKESKGNHVRDIFRNTLKRLGFLQLQKSVYLYPYPCEDVIEFARQLCDVGEYVTLLTVGHLENEEAYREYFGI